MLGAADGGSPEPGELYGVAWAVEVVVLSTIGCASGDEVAVAVGAAGVVLGLAGVVDTEDVSIVTVGKSSVVPESAIGGSGYFALGPTIPRGGGLSLKLTVHAVQRSRTGTPCWVEGVDRRRHSCSNQRVT